MKSLIYKIGNFFTGSFSTFTEFLGFSAIIFSRFLRLKLFNPAIKLVLIRQIYFTGVQILSVFSIISFLLGFIFVGFLTRFLISINAEQELSRVLSILIIRELAPLISVIMLALRSSTAVSAEIAVMNITGEANTLRMYNIDLIDYLYIPRIVAGLLSMLCLATFFTLFSLVGGYILISYQMGIDFGYMVKLIFDYLSLSDIICFLYKSIFFGYILMAIPIFTSKSVKKANTEIPIALLKGMMRLFYGIIIVEVMGVFI